MIFLKKYSIILLLFIVFLILLQGFPKKEEKHQNDMEKNQLLYRFYQKEKEERYQQYKQIHPEMEDIDIITRVNLNLDKPYYEDAEPALYLNTNLVFVNKYHYLEENYEPTSLEKLEKCSSGNRLLQKDAKEDFERLCEQAEKEGKTIRVVSSYRSYSYQKTLYDNYVLKDGKEKADTYSARSGFSEHQTGLVIDVDNAIKSFEDFEETEEFTWMQENAHRFGFILRYPKGKEDITGYQYESWHYRYVGEKVATFLKENNMTFDEYIARDLARQGK